VDWNAPHLGYVLASYGLSFVVIGILVIYIIWRDRRLRREVANLASRASDER
jgi:heme exporter protein CcmD